MILLAIHPRPLSAYIRASLRLSVSHRLHATTRHTVNAVKFNCNAQGLSTER